MMEMQTMVSRSIAARRSITVGPRISRRTPRPTPQKMRTAATIRRWSAKGLLQVSLERARNGLSDLLGINGSNIQTMNHELIFPDIENQRPRREADRVCQS